MRKLYKITYDIKIKREWITGPNGFKSSHVVINEGHDASKAIERVKAYEYKDSDVTEVRVLKAELIADDVI